MSKTLHEAFHLLKDLKLDYGSTNFTDVYWRIAREIDIDDFLGYRAEHSKYLSQHPACNGQSSVLHIILSVKVSEDSDFVPFFSIIGDSGVLPPDVRQIFNQKGKKEIKYDYSKFLSDFRHFNSKYGCGDYLEVPRCAFTVDSCTGTISDLRFLPSVAGRRYWFKDDDSVDITVEGLNRKDPGKGDCALKELNENLMRENSFVKVISNYYKSLGINHLRYSFFNIDTDFITNECLTRLMIISTDPDEVVNFMEMNLNKVREIVSFIRTRYVYDLLQKNKYEAIKSAVSAIMSRNMSHNLGSHYMYYTKAYLEKMATNVGDIAPDIRGAAKVLGYVQARMDYLATVISNDKYPYGAVNFKSQLYDELTVDDFSHRHFPDEPNKRTTNFLLTNLIYSENFTRPNVRSDEKIDSNSDKLFLYVKYSNDGKNYENFTGTWHDINYSWVLEECDSADEKGETRPPTVLDEQNTKNILSSLNIAMPGGTMSCHAFFNIVENFIRNSAKYLREDISKENGLVCTMAIKPNADKKYVDIIIYDNKHNANTETDSEKHSSLYQQILDKLSSLIIIDEQNKISKDNKGFKEMLFSSIWMRAYTFGKKTYADIISEINQIEAGEKKISIIEKHGFSLVKIKEENDGNISIFTRNNDCNDTCNLGILITLPVFNQTEELSLSEDRTENINAMLNIMSDIVEVDADFPKSEFRHVFPHALAIESGRRLSTLEKYRAVIQKRFPDINEYSLSFGEKSVAEESFSSATPEHMIYFKRHIDTQETAAKFNGYAYADSISGGNFTITLLELFKNGIENGRYKTEEGEILALKIKESALTRITLVDERLFNSTKERDYPWLELKNIRILNYSDQPVKPEDDTLSPVFIGSDFKDKKNETHFLSIHLGLIEKTLKNSDYVNRLINNRLHLTETSEDGSLSSNRVTALMELLKEYFGGKNANDNLYIAVHSGRGNYSAELEGPLSTYPFISLSALENAYNNSKYQLAQLFYNTVYLGKGVSNNPLKTPQP